MQRTLLLLLVAVSYALFAGAAPWTIGVLFGVAGVAVAASPRRILHFPADFRPLDLATAAVAAAMLLQVLPMPIAVIGWISPHVRDVQAAQAFTGVAASGYTTLSLDRAATVNALWSFALAVLTFWIARGTFSVSGNTRSFCRVLAFIGAVAAAGAVLQRAITPRLVMFLREPEAGSAYPFGAFINRNHFGGWLVMMLAVAGGYLVARLRIHPAFRGRWRASVKQFFGSSVIVTAAAAAVMAMVLAATLSRSAVLGLGAGALVAWRLSRLRARTERTSLPAQFGWAAVVIIAAVVFVDVDSWLGRLREGFAAGGEGALDRTVIWSETLPVAADFWLTGTGAGTFSEAMTHYQQSRVWIGSMQRWAHINNAHSHYLQLAAEGGLLLTLPVIAALAALVRLGRRAIGADKGEMFWVRVGAAAGLTGIAVQSIWETSLLMPANSVLCGVLAGLLLHHRESTRAPA